MMLHLQARLATAVREAAQRAFGVALGDVAFQYPPKVELGDLALTVPFDLAKGLIDEGFHPMTMYFPLVVHGAMLVEPTETESKASLDQFIAAMRSLAVRAKSGDANLKAAPLHAPRRRLDETLAARKPVLVYRDPEPAQAAE